MNPQFLLLITYHLLLITHYSLLVVYTPLCSGDLVAELLQNISVNLWLNNYHYSIIARISPLSWVKNPNIVAVRFIGLFNRASFIVETFAKNYFFTTLLDLPKFISPEGLSYIWEGGVDLSALRKMRIGESLRC